MIRKYLFRKNYKGTFEIEGERLTGHLAFKTQETSWLGTHSPIVVLVSVHSAFHVGMEGFLKMDAFLSTIKSCVEGKISILIADTAHLAAETLLQRANSCLQAGRELALRYQSLLVGYEILYWHTLCKGEDYAHIRSQLLLLIESDAKIHDLLRLDAESTYTEKRAQECPNKASFIQATITDLVDQCVVLQLLSQRGYRTLFYPGAPYQSTEYLRSTLQSQLRWIDVFLSIEKKTKVSITPSQELSALLYSNQLG